MATFEGTLTALVTPFRDGEVDEEALRALVESQIEGGISGLVPCGTTGESVTLRGDEHRRVVRTVVAAAKGRVPVVAGAGTVSTQHSIELAELARDEGADGLLLVCPYYNRPTQDGLHAHFTAIAQAVPLPAILYNIPGRTGVDMSVETVGRLLSLDSIVGVKEATGNVLRAQELVERFGDRLCVLSGDDALTLPMLAVGARGVISVTSNLLPAAVSKVVERFVAGDVAGARALHQALLPLHRVMFVESNPGPVKFTLARRGMIAPEVRLPLVWPSPAAQMQVANELAAWEGRT